MKSQIILTIVSASMLMLSTGCTSSKTTEINVLATTDLHGEVPYKITEYIKTEKEKNPNTAVADAGDFFDINSYGTPMNKYFNDRDSDIRQGNEKYIEMPLVKEMKEAGYDAVVLGNHEFVSNNKFYLDNIASDFEKYNVDLLSANTYKKDDTNYVKPYTIKQMDTTDGTVNLGILGLTIKEVDKSRELKDMPQYNKELYINDLVDEANKWVKIMKEKENTDIIVAVVHSGEKPKKPKNPGNRIQELAQEVKGIDAIVAGHTHKTFEQHDYKNSEGKEVIVTQPGKHGEAISKITFDLEKKNGDWKLVNKYAKLTEFEETKFDELVYELLYKISSLKEDNKEINLGDVVPFEWDKAYSFDTNTPIEKIYETVGYKWQSIISKDKDSDLQIVFMKDDKVVCYLYGDMNMMGISMNFDKSSYKDGVVKLYPNKNDKFNIKKGEDEYTTHLTYIE